MSIEQNIVDAVEISRHSRIPVLFMSNPGLGKTTILTKYAKVNNMHLETLIGSRFSPEEISGYMVNNGGTHLAHMSPEWFSRIQEKSAKGIPTLLFVDELSTCSEFVQGALLSLIFDRSIGCGKFLPKDCLIVAAANYAGNLPSTMGIMAPTLNRFIIINLNDNYNALDMMDEFLCTPKPPVYPKGCKEFTDAGKKGFMETYRNIWKEVFIKYSDRESSLGILDISNQDIDGLYTEGNGCIYNFISGRSLSYLSRALMSYVSLGIKNSDVLHKTIDGLVGAGTCLFKEKPQGKRYRELLYKNFDKLVSSDSLSAKNFMPIVHDISKDINAFIMNQENAEFSQNDSLKQLVEIVNEIREAFELEEVIVLCKTESGRAKFISDMDAIMQLRVFLEKRGTSKNTYLILCRVCLDFYGIYCEILGMRPDYQKRFGLQNPFFRQICFFRIRGKEKITYYKAACMSTGNSVNRVTLYKLDMEEFCNPNHLTSLVNGKNVEVLTYYGGERYIPLKDYMEQASYIFRRGRLAG